MQALGSYRGGHMLFLGLGTGLGSALVWDGCVLPLELGQLPFRDRGVIEDLLGNAGLAELGKRDWLRLLQRCVVQLKRSLIADYVVLGGGNARLLDQLPEGAELGHNRNAYRGGIRLWQSNPRTGQPKWRVV